MADQLLLTLLYVWQYHTFLQLGQLFDISESYAQKRYTFIVKLLLQALNLPNEKAVVVQAGRDATLTSMITSTRKTKFLYRVFA